MLSPLFTACALIAVAAGGLTACGGSSSTSGGGTKPTPPFTAAGNGSSDFCAQMGAVVAQFSHAGAAFTGTSPGATPDVDAFKHLIASSATAIDGLDSQAPGEISSAFHTLRAAYDQANTQAQAATRFDQLANIFTGLDQGAIKAANQQVDAYLRTKCGITPSASTPAPTATP